MLDKAKTIQIYGKNYVPKANALAYFFPSVNEKKKFKKIFVFKTLK
jgi:hypothetical protein